MPQGLQGRSNSRCFSELAKDIQPSLTFPFSFCLAIWQPPKLIIILRRPKFCVLDKLRTIIPILKVVENNSTRCPSFSQLKHISQTSSQDIEPCYEASTSPRTLSSLARREARVIRSIASRRGTSRTSTCSWREAFVATGRSRPSHATIFRSASESRNSSIDVWMPMTTVSMSSSHTNARFRPTASLTMKTMAIITIRTRMSRRRRAIPVSRRMSYRDISVYGPSWPWCFHSLFPLASACFSPKNS